MWPIVPGSARAARRNGVKSYTDFASAAPSGSQAPPLLDNLLCNLAAGSGPGDLRGCSRYGSLCQVAAERHAVEMVSIQTSVGRAHGRELVKKSVVAQGPVGKKQCAPNAKSLLATCYQVLNNYTSFINVYFEVILSLSRAHTQRRDEVL